MTTEEQISTITQFLEATGAKLRIYDLGRRVTKISRDSFLQFEKTEIPYPYPMQQQAWFALIFQDDEEQIEPFIWFLRFPLDEQGKLLQAARDDFMHRLMERIGENLQAAKEGETLDAALKDNPYTFKPREDRMAVFHAKAKQLFKLPPSKFHEHAVEYFSGKLGWDQWGFVGYQGIAEIAAAQGQAEVNAMLVEAIPQLPEKPLEALCHCLENESINMILNQALLDRLKLHLTNHSEDTLTTAALVRAVADSQSVNLKKATIAAALKSKTAESVDLLAAVSGRCWEALLDDEICLAFLEKLARNSEGQPFFNECLGDLLFIPGMRTPLLTSIRNPERSPELGNAIGQLFQGLSGSGG